MQEKGLFHTDRGIYSANEALCKNALNRFELEAVDQEIHVAGLGKMVFYTIHGLTRFWDGGKTEKPLRAGELAQQMLTGLCASGVAFAYLLIGTAKGIEVCIGVSEQHETTLLGCLKAVYKGIHFESRKDISDLNAYSNCIGGIACGIPLGDEEDTSPIPVRRDQIEMICSAMMGEEFVYCVLAQSIPSAYVQLAHKKLLDVMQPVSFEVNRTIVVGAMKNDTRQVTDYTTQDYLDNLTSLEKKMKAGCSIGMWYVNTYFSAKDRKQNLRLKNVIKSVFSSETSRPEPYRCMLFHRTGALIARLNMIDNLAAGADTHPLGYFADPQNGQRVRFDCFQFLSVLNSQHLGALCALPLREMPGYYIDDYVEFDTAQRPKGNEAQAPDNMITLGQVMFTGRSDNDTVDNPYQFEVDDLNRHGMVIGVTGGGKTNTSKHLLMELWNKKKRPFLVIESAKREYWELMNLPGFEDMMLFTLGLETPGASIRYRINPFEVVGDTSLQTHIDYLLSTFKAAFELYPPMPYVLETSVYEIYADRGWNIVTNTNEHGLSEYPTLLDLYRKIDPVTDQLGYNAEAASNTKAALKARINSLMIGGKGAMMNAKRSVPIEKLLSTPTVLELEDLGDDDTKAFVIGLLLVQLYEYRKASHKVGQGKFVHLMMIEEAHRLLKNVPETSGTANPRAKSVEFFCNLLAEIRSYGQGFLIADQIPTKLAPDTIKNTNLKIVHRIVAEEDRQAIGKAMNMTEEQIYYLSGLRRGFAAVYAEGDSHPKLVKFPLVENANAMNRRQVLERIQKTVSEVVNIPSEWPANTVACSYCEEKDCIYWKNVNSHPYWNNKTVMEDLISRTREAKFEVKALAVAVKFFVKHLHYSEPRQGNISDFMIRQCVLGKFLKLARCSEDVQVAGLLRYRKWYCKNYLEKGSRHHGI